MVETIRLTATGSAFSPHTRGVVGQTASGDIGLMLVAVVLLVGLGLAAVAIWHGQLSEIFGRFASSADRGAEQTQHGSSTSGTASTEAERPAEPSAGQQLGSPQSTEQERTDREIVLDILDENDGRMKQARIVDATDWSKSKVSMVLSEMEEEGDITKLRVGRENIISLEGSEPEAAGSPFDDE